MGLLYEGGAVDARDEVRFARFTEDWLTPRRGPDPTTDDLARHAEPAAVLGGAPADAACAAARWSSTAPTTPYACRIRTDSRSGRRTSPRRCGSATRPPAGAAAAVDGRDRDDAAAGVDARQARVPPDHRPDHHQERSRGPDLRLRAHRERLQPRPVASSGPAPGRRTAHALLSTVRRSGAADVPGSVSRNSPFGVHVGQRMDSRAYFTGAIDEVRVYDRVLNDDELSGAALPGSDPGHRPVSAHGPGARRPLNVPSVPDDARARRRRTGAASVSCSPWSGRAAHRPPRPRPGGRRRARPVAAVLERGRSAHGRVRAIRGRREPWTTGPAATARTGAAAGRAGAVAVLGHVSGPGARASEPGRRVVRVARHECAPGAELGCGHGEGRAAGDDTARRRCSPTPGRGVAVAGRGPCRTALPGSSGQGRYRVLLGRVPPARLPGSTACPRPPRSPRSRCPTCGWKASPRPSTRVPVTDPSRRVLFGTSTVDAGAWTYVFGGDDGQATSRPASQAYVARVPRGRLGQPGGLGVLGRRRMGGAGTTGAGARGRAAHGGRQRFRGECAPGAYVLFTMAAGTAA